MAASPVLRRVKVAVVLNPRAGSVQGNEGASLRDRVRHLLLQRGIQAEFVSVESESLKSGREPPGGGAAQCVVAVGGDGTVRTAAGFALAKNLPLALLPAGTLNHFARDLEIPLDWEEAAALIAGQETIRIDLGEVNGERFVNNASVGLYPNLVVARESRRSVRRLPRLAGCVLSSLEVLQRFPLLTVHLSTSEGERIRRTPFVFVGNNRYSLDRFSLGSRERLDQGQLCLYLAHCPSRRRLFRLLLLALRNRLHQADDFETDMVEAAVIDSARRRLKVALDGEVLRLEPPLRFRVLPRALSVCSPKAAR